MADLKAVTALKEFALGLPEAEVGTICNNLSFRAGIKNFLFLGVKAKEGTWNLRLKLGESLSSARALGKKDKRFEVGDNGWTYVEFALDEEPPEGLLEGWTEESFRLLVPKKISSKLDK